MNIFVQRSEGAIVGIYANFQEGFAEEPMDDSDPEVIAFLNPVSITDYENAIQNLVDSTARERQFRDGVTLASYIGSTKPKWAAEAQAFVAWRDNVWFYAYGELAKVQAGQREQPTVEQFLAEIAPIAWPLS
ncbi:hypothetical protein EN837_08440 [bacterium M00.F.Ca.ET.194.01.1.1]|nr:hypothetical protein EN837_08440 [bacterium M00.F.Ca.ET.194.01.1.1]TGS56288.1 hypothetical protein EN822_08440 [bacterium M00.F.Ca.ET.179.01.1.1]TGV49193.1 hypothetical protein EN811_08440 [bacterium M00.F.Ca.ET.168.01.1.1]